MKFFWSLIGTQYKVKLKLPNEWSERFECSQVCLSIQIRGFGGEISKTNSTFSKTEPLNGTQRSSVDWVESIADYNDVFSRWFEPF